MASYKVALLLGLSYLGVFDLGRQRRGDPTLNSGLAGQIP